MRSQSSRCALVFVASLAVVQGCGLVLGLEDIVVVPITGSSDADIDALDGTVDTNVQDAPILDDAGSSDAFDAGTKPVIEIVPDAQEVELEDGDRVMFRGECGDVEVYVSGAGGGGINGGIGGLGAGGAGGYAWARFKVTSDLFLARVGSPGARNVAGAPGGGAPADGGYGGGGYSSFSLVDGGDGLIVFAGGGGGAGDSTGAMSGRNCVGGAGGGTAGQGGTTQQGQSLINGGTQVSGSHSGGVAAPSSIAAGGGGGGWNGGGGGIGTCGGGGGGTGKVSTTTVLLLAGETEGGNYDMPADVGGALPGMRGRIRVRCPAKP